MMEREELLALARETAQRAHSPYSHFRVGAALVAGEEVFVGVNIEISSYGLTLCAERSALAAALSPLRRVLLRVSLLPVSMLVRMHPIVNACLVVPAVSGWQI